MATLKAQRVYKLVARTAHLIVTGILLGGYIFDAPIAPLRLLLCLSAATGVAMLGLEAYPNRHFFREGWALMLWLKLVLLLSVPMFWSVRVPILVAVVVIASIGSHMPRTLRHWTAFHPKTTV
jgi:hypothetical protein